mmetsp:Transcript_35661/g.98320  ORF Transcript_35661/g.98320 Transcript_35661/m.98320 type:complete len:139 (+) Transcript_35661:580-996(+)
MPNIASSMPAGQGGYMGVPFTKCLRSAGGLLGIGVSEPVGVDPKKLRAVKVFLAPLAFKPTKPCEASQPLQARTRPTHVTREALAAELAPAHGAERRFLAEAVCRQRRAPPTKRGINTCTIQAAQEERRRANVSKYVT